MGESWYDTSYRKLFFDFHSPGTTVGLAAAFDAGRWATRIEQANAQAVSVFAKCGFGYSFYRQGKIRYVHPHLPAGLDMLGEQITALHKRGIRAIAYYHMFNSEPLAQARPDWLERDADGKPRGIALCQRGPSITEWLLPHIEEIVTLYDIDALFFDGCYACGAPCYCAGCKERFAQATGGLGIPSGKDDPHWRSYVAWNLDAYRQLRQAICDAVHRHRPEIPVCFNWVYTLRLPEVVPEDVGWLAADVPPDDQTFNGSYLAHYWAALDRPFDIMNSAFLQWWGDWGCKPAIAMQQEVATAIANGGLTWIGYQMTEKFDVASAVMAELGKTLAFVKEREPLLKGTRPVPYVAVLHSSASILAGDGPAFLADETVQRGVHRLLTESMIPYHFLQESKLLAQLDEFRAVILPNQLHLPPDLADALAAWVKKGGVVLATALTGTRDENYVATGRFALESLLGVRYEGICDQSHAYIEVTDARLRAGTLDMPHLAEAPFALVRPVTQDVQTLARLRKIYLRSDGQPLLRWSPVGEDSGYPAITLRRVGRGWAAYLAGEVFRAYQAKNQWNLKAIVANLLRLTVENPLITIEAPVWLEVVLRQQSAQDAPHGRERLLVHLVNHHGDRPVDGNNYCLEHVLPVPDVTVHLRCPLRPSQVTLDPGGSVPEWEYHDAVVSVRVPEVRIHQVVAIETAAGL